MTKKTKEAVAEAKLPSSFEPIEHADAQPQSVTNSPQLLTQEPLTRIGMEPLIKSERKAFHKALLSSVLFVNSKGVPSNADKDSTSSVLYANGIVRRLESETSETVERLAGQTSGHQFEGIVTNFLINTFKKLPQLRPGKWDIFQVAKKKKRKTEIKIAQYSQYEHLQALYEAVEANAKIRASLGNDYTITPDIIISRERESDEAINEKEPIVDDSTARLTDIRLANGSSGILHASISTKWTLRSDRAQNARSEALNLIRNRKGHLPHVIVVTAEPTPSRLSSIALGTGDIDCVYHFALYELREAIIEAGHEEALNMLEIMINGKRMKDISDLPLDLAI